MKRIFVAVDVPDAIRQQLAWMAGGVPRARWIDEDNIHLTLRFIGEVDGADYRDILDALERVRLEPFDMTLAGVGHFPPRGKPKVLWVGVEPNPTLKRLRDRVERVLIAAGVDPEHRKFHPHVTLARLRDSPPKRVARFLEERALYRSDSWRVDEFAVYSSTLHPDGAVYAQEYVFPLDGDEG